MAEQQGWLWDQNAGQVGQYRDFATGELVPESDVIEFVNDIIDDTTGDPLETLNTMLEDGRLSAEEWAAAFALLLQTAYIQQAELAAGGREQMTPEQWALVIAALGVQYGFLEDFARQVRNGQLTPAQIEARTKMYINSSREAFWSVKDQKALGAGYTQERWDAVGDSSTCSPCADAERMGWQPIGTFGEPGSGRVLNNPPTTCEGLTNCRCEKFYR